MRFLTLDSRCSVAHKTPLLRGCTNAELTQKQTLQNAGQNPVYRCDNLPLSLHTN
jgi:hypothetical protein